MPDSSTFSARQFGNILRKPGFLQIIAAVLSRSHSVVSRATRQTGWVSFSFRSQHADKVPFTEWSRQSSVKHAFDWWLCLRLMEHPVNRYCTIAFGVLDFSKIVVADKQFYSVPFLIVRLLIDLRVCKAQTKLTFILTPICNKQPFNERAETFNNVNPETSAQFSSWLVLTFLTWSPSSSCWCFCQIPATGDWREGGGGNAHFHAVIGKENLPGDCHSQLDSTLFARLPSH